MSMSRRFKRYGLSLIGIGVAIGVIAPVVLAQTGDTEDYVLPGSTTVTTSLASGTISKFVAPIGAFTVTQSCTASSTTGKTPAHGLSLVVAPVSFTGCKDSLGGTDTVKSSGTWRVTGLDAANDETTEPPAGPNSGDHLRITVPMDGATVTSSMDATCLITVAPTAAVQVVGKYNDHNRLTITNAAVPIKYTATGTPGCPGGNGSGTGKFTATYILTPGVHDAS
jgi:hypothetical protein